MMDHTRFAALAEAYGGDIARWPDAEREAALAYETADPERANVVLSEAAVLDHALAAGGRVEPAAGLEAAILAAAPSTRLGNSAPPRWAGLAAALALMVGAGAGWLAAPAGDPYAEPLFAEAFGALETAETLDDFTEEDAR